MSDSSLIGRRLGTYEITALLGAGGMGEVYRARDTRLDRDVALKILPVAFASDRDRLARFEREARTLASLNHANIAQIYGIEEGAPSTLSTPSTPSTPSTSSGQASSGQASSGQAGPPRQGSGQAGQVAVRALVMELVPGETLAMLIQRQAERQSSRGLPVEDCLAIGRQLADALEAAHEHGVVHRDLKPANIAIASDGAVKVLDFGLAKALAPDSSALDPVNSPTFTSPATEFGMILGTAAYMAPEQARGKPVDRRADIWAFGCVLYEALSGRRAFPGETTSDTIAGLLRGEVDWGALPPDTPETLRRLLARCLEKDPRRRLRDIGEARIALDENPPLSVRTAAPSQAASRVQGRAVNAWLAAAVPILIVLLAAASVRLWRSGGPTAPVVRYDVQPPPKTTLRLKLRPSIALSPDGSTLAYVAVLDGVPRLYIRPRNATGARALAGTEGASAPEFSPDGTWITFFSDGKIKKAPLDGPPVTLTSGADVRGIGWSDDNTLIFPPGAADPLVRMSADGGDARPLTTLTENERTHRWPQVLPGGKAAIFTVGSPATPDSYDDATIDAVIVATGERRQVLRGAAMARYVRSGHLVYSKGPALYAIAFDPETLTTRGAPKLIVQGVERDSTTGAAHFACAADGTLADVPGGAEARLHRIVWADRKGVTEPLDLSPALYNDLRVSPDGTRIAFVIGPSGSADVWVYDLTRKANTRLTFTGTNAGPVWSDDSRTIVYTALDSSGRKATVFRKPADGGREAEVVGTTEGRAFVAWVSADEKSALLDFLNPGPGMADIVRLPLLPQSRPSAFVSGPSDDYGASVSADGRWLAYHTDETGRFEVYVRDMSGSGARWQVSAGGGEEAHWSRDGREIFYRAGNRLMAVEIGRGTAFQSATPRVLFEDVYNLRSDTARSYDVDPKTGRFLMLRPVGDGEPTTIRVVVNWFEELRALMPAR